METPATGLGREEMVEQAMTPTPHNTQHRIFLPSTLSKHRVSRANALWCGVCCGRRRHSRPPGGSAPQNEKAFSGPSGHDKMISVKLPGDDKKTPKNGAEAMEDEPKPRRRGRPRRGEKAVADKDPATVDPRRVLAAVASDVSAPAGARVSAARALLRDRVDRDLRQANGSRLAHDPDDFEEEAQHD